MSQLTVSLDLFAGILVAIHFLLPKRVQEKIDNWLKAVISLPPGAEDPGHDASLWISITIILILFVVFITWSICVDLGKAVFSFPQLVVINSMVLAGVIVGTGILVGVVLAKKFS